jgi:ribose 1,5-bisphosphokinase
MLERTWRSALRRMSGPLVYVMGPSGAGKDSVLNRARSMLSIDLPIVFAHRYITRPAEAGGENHVALSGAEFALRRAHGLFAFHWQAHGNDYGIGLEVHAWRKAGLTVVVSGSREHFQKMDGIDEDTVPVLITAPAERRRERLAMRGREDTDAAAERLRRGVAHDIDAPDLVTIVNDGALDDAAEAFVRLLATLRRSPAARRRAGTAPAR